jgi:hypothetical protein
MSFSDSFNEFMQKEDFEKQNMDEKVSSSFETSTSYFSYGFIFIVFLLLGLTAYVYLAKDQLRSLFPPPPPDKKNKDKDKDKDKDKKKNSPPPPPPYTEDHSTSSIQKGGKNGFCYIGKDHGYRSCASVRESDICVSGDIFPTMEICINPSLRS